MVKGSTKIGKREKLSYIAVVFLWLALSIVSPSTRGDSDAEGGVRWSFTPYIWLMDTAVDVRVNGESIDQEIKFTDVVDKVEFAFQGHLERNTDRFGLFADFTYFSIADDVSEHGVTTDADIKLGLYEAGALYHLTGTSVQGLSVFGGLRVVSAEQKIKLQGEGDAGLQHSSSNSKNHTDLMLGARYVQSFSERWQWGIRADYADGDTEGTWNLQALVARQFRSKKFNGSLVFGYRYMQMDLEDGPIISEFTLSGPMIGTRFEF